MEERKCWQPMAHSSTAITGAFFSAQLGQGTDGMGCEVLLEFEM